MRAVLDRVQTNGKHLLGLINDVLDLSKIEAGQLVLSLSDYSIQDMVQGVYTCGRAAGEQQKSRFWIEVPPDLPRAHGDERRLTQVLLNLVGNAIKFTDTGEVAIKASAANGAYTIAVHDTGPGIADADQAKIFEEFQQADSSPTKRRAAPGSACRSPSASSKCMAARCGSSRARATVRPFRSRCRSGLNNRRSGHEQAHSRGRGSGR